MTIAFDQPPRVLLAPTAGYARNDLLANGNWVRSALSRQISMLQNRCMPVMPGKNLVGRTVRNTATAARLWATQVSMPGNAGQLVVDVQLLPTDTAAGSPRWWLTQAGGAGSFGDQFHNVRCPAGSGTSFDDVFEMQQVIDIDPSTETTIELWTDDNCRVVGWDLHVKPNDTISSHTSKIDYANELPLSEVRSVGSPTYLYPPGASAANGAIQEGVWSRQRAYHLNWQVDDPASPINVNSTVAADLWGASTVGPTAPTQYRNSYANENLLAGIAAKSVRTYVWAYGERTAGAGNVIARFISDAVPGGFDLNINGAIGMYTDGDRGDLLGFKLLPQAAGDCIRVKYLVSAGGTTGKIYAVGCFQMAD